jgi:pimeloyl-ACP methyl ester carboxylesterase
LDSIRGVLQTNELTGLSKDAKVICWGYSGGTIPTSWTSALIDEYPDIQDNLIGAVLGGYVANLTGAAVANEGSLYAGLVASAIAGLTKQFPKFDELVRDELSPQQYQELMYATDNGRIPVLYKFRFERFFLGTGDKIWSKSGFAILRNQILVDIVEELTLGATKDSTLPKIPLFVYHGKNDEILPWKETKQTVENWCEWGVDSIEFFTDSLSGHATGFVYSGPAVVKWMSDRFDGVESVKGCNSFNSFTFLNYPNSTKEVFHFGLASLKSFVGLKVGPTNVLEEVYQISSSIFASTKSFIFSFSTPWIAYNRLQNYIGKITVK